MLLSGKPLLKPLRRQGVAAASGLGAGGYSVGSSFRPAAGGGVGVGATAAARGVVMQQQQNPLPYAIGGSSIPAPYQQQSPPRQQQSPLAPLPYQHPGYGGVSGASGAIQDLLGAAARVAPQENGGNNNNNNPMVRRVPDGQNGHRTLMLC